MEKKCDIFVVKRLHISIFGRFLDFTFEKFFWLRLDLDWVLKNQDWIWITKYDSPLISGVCVIFSYAKTWVNSRGGRSHFFRLRLRSCSKIIESGFRSGNFPNLRIWLLFKIRPPSTQPKITHVLLMKWPRRLLLLPKFKSDSGSGVKRNFWLLRNFWPIIVCQLFSFSE